MAHLRIVTNEEIITCEEPLDIYKLGSIDEESYIEFESDECIIKENRNKNDYIIKMKNKDNEVNRSFINEVCKDIDRIRIYLNELFKFRLDTRNYIDYSNREWNKYFKDHKH